VYHIHALCTSYVLHMQTDYISYSESLPLRKSDLHLKGICHACMNASPVRLLQPDIQ